MDLIKIGKFIAELRKENGMTQEQLGEKVGVTNKTVSRWETGTYLPPADALLEMSTLFHVSINDLLSGRKLTDAEYKAAAEENLTRTIRESHFTWQEKVAYYKGKWLKDHTSTLIVFGICIAAVFLTGFVQHRPWVIYSSLLLTVLAHAWRHNTMMAYVERMAFDGSGQ